MADPPTRIAEAGPVVPAVTPFTPRNLTLTAYVDNGAPAPATPDGNIESPFATFNAANLANPTAIYVAPGNYLAEGPVSFIPPGCTVYGIGDAPREVVPFDTLRCPLLPALDFSPPPGLNEFFFENCRVPIVGASGNVFSITVRNCYTISTEPGAYITFVEGGVFQGDAGGQGIFARNADLVLGVSLTAGAGFNRFENCTVQSGCNFAFDVAGGVLQLDCATLASLHLAAATVTDGGVSVLDGPALTYMWGASNATTGQFLNPGIKFGNAAAAATSEWSSCSTRRYAHTIHAQLTAAHTQDITCTLFVGATVGGLAATALTVTIPQGDLEATFDLDTALELVPAGGYMAVDFVSVDPLAASAIEVLVGLS